MWAEHAEVEGFVVEVRVVKKVAVDAGPYAVGIVVNAAEAVAVVHVRVRPVHPAHTADLVVDRAPQPMPYLKCSLPV